MKTFGMNRVTIAAVLLAAACKNDPAPAPSASAPSSSAAPSSAAPSSAAPSPGTPGSAHGTGSANPHGSGVPGAAPNAHGTPPMAAQTAPRTLEKRADGRVALGPFSLAVPAGWKENPSTSSMRAAQFTVPGSGGEDAEVVVYYFGEGGAGGVQANIDRWVNQFKQPDDKPSSSVAKIEKATFAGQESSVVSVSGRYVAPAMPGGPPTDKPDHALVAAIVPSPKGPYYFRLVGPKAAVAAQESAFREALASLKIE